MLFGDSICNGEILDANVRLRTLYCLEVAVVYLRFLTGKYGT